MKRQSWISLLALILLTAVWTACESSEDDKINQAQNCLDRATDAASANICAASVAGISGPRAAIIRCSADWIGQGFTTQSTKFLDAFHALKNDTSGADKTVAMMKYLAFDTVSNANAAVTDCTQTGIAGLITFSSMAKLATNLKALTDTAGGNSSDPVDLQSQVQNLDDQTAGEVAEAVAENYCQNSSTNNASFCGQFNAAVQDPNMTTAQIGCLLKLHLGASITCP